MNKIRNVLMVSSLMVGMTCTSCFDPNTDNWVPVSFPFELDNIESLTMTYYDNRKKETIAFFIDDKYIVEHRFYIPLINLKYNPKVDKKYKIVESECDKLEIKCSLINFTQDSYVIKYYENGVKTGRFFFNDEKPHRTVADVISIIFVNMYIYLENNNLLEESIIKPTISDSTTSI